MDQNLLHICVTQPNVCPRNSAKNCNNIIVINTLKQSRMIRTVFLFCFFYIFMV